MKTYIVEENYGDSFRVTVEDDVQVGVNTYDGNHEGALVKFTAQGPNYSDNVIAAIGRVNRVYLEDTEIERKSYPMNETAKAEPDAPAEMIWTAI